jgi:hypothetical protein
MSTQFDKDVSGTLSVIMPRAEARAAAAGHPLRATERSEIARLVRESLGGNLQALTALQVWVGAPSPPVKPAAPAVDEETDLGRALLAGQHRSPFFAETAPRTVKEISEDAGIPGASPGISNEIGHMALIDGDSAFHELARSWAMSVPFGGRRLNG